VKLLAYGWSSQRSLPALRDQVDAALAAAKRTGWDGLCGEQREYLDDVWERADIELEGDPALQQAVRFALFHVIQAGARAERRAIPATVPVLTYVAPAAARDVLRWRHSTIDVARARARELGLDGVTFPWRTIGGQECSGYGPPARPPSTSTRTSPTRCAAISPPRATRSSGRARGSSCWWPRRGCGARWATTTPRARSGSTPSPAPTSTPRSSTTTSTRT